MSKRNTPAQSAASKRAAFAGQRQQFAAKGRAKSYGPTKNERYWARVMATQSCYSAADWNTPVASWVAL
jgi:hypothetical protein